MCWKRELKVIYWMNNKEPKISLKPILEAALQALEVFLQSFIYQYPFILIYDKFKAQKTVAQRSA